TTSKTPSPGPMCKRPPASPFRPRRCRPNPGTTTENCAEPPPKWHVPAKSSIAPAETSNRGTSCDTSTSTALGQPARTTPFIAATSGEPDPKSVVKVTTGGAVEPLPVPRFFPGVCFVVIATLLPET